LAGLDHDTKMKLIGFACAFAWADLELHPKEREFVLKLMERLEIDAPQDRQRVMRWLKTPPLADDVDPYSIPRSAREVFVRECEQVILADGVVQPEETEAMTLLKKVLFGDSTAGGKKMAKAGAQAQDRSAVIAQMNKILQLELAGVSRYLHYSFLVFGPNRIPIVSFFREQANEGIQHAIMIGEKITAFGGHPTIVVENPPEPPRHDVRSLLQESLDFERRGLEEYRNLLRIVGEDVALEELVRGQVRAETEHCEEVEKMLREVAR
jgi:bacterioferritin